MGVTRRGLRELKAFRQAWLQADINCPPKWLGAWVTVSLEFNGKYLSKQFTLEKKRFQHADLCEKISLNDLNCP